MKQNKRVALLFTRGEIFFISDVIIAYMTYIGNQHYASDNMTKQVQIELNVLEKINSKLIKATQNDNRDN